MIYVEISRSSFIIYHFNFPILIHQWARRSFNKLCVWKCSVEPRTCCVTWKSNQRETQLRKISGEGQLFDEDWVVRRSLAIVMRVTLEIDVDRQSARFQSSKWSQGEDNRPVDYISEEKRTGKGLDTSRGVAKGRQRFDKVDRYMGRYIDIYVRARMSSRCDQNRRRDQSIIHTCCHTRTCFRRIR